VSKIPGDLQVLLRGEEGGVTERPKVVVGGKRVVRIVVVRVNEGCMVSVSMLVMDSMSERVVASVGGRDARCGGGGGVLRV
jgi:hypothetical protein